MEIDGVSITGKISATNAKAELNDQSIEVKWDVVNPEGKAKIWLATTNHFKTGGKDAWKLVATVPVAAAKAKVNVRNLPSGFYKIAIQLPYNYLNRWVMVTTANK